MREAKRRFFERTEWVLKHKLSGAVNAIFREGNAARNSSPIRKRKGWNRKEKKEIQQRKKGERFPREENIAWAGYRYY